MTNAASAGFQGQDLATQLLLKQQAQQRQKAQMQDEDTQRKAKALIGQKLTEIMQAGGQTPPAGAPAPGAIPGGAGGGSPMSGGPPGAGGGTPPQQGGQQMPQGQPGSAMGAPEAQFSWNGVLDSLRHMTGADPSVIADAVMEIMPEIDKEAGRKGQADQAQANRDQKNYALLQTLQWRYQNSQDQTERTQIKADMDKVVAGMRTDAQRDVAKTQADSRENVAKTQAGWHTAVAEQNRQSRKEIADAGLALKKELGNRALDVKIDDITSTATYRERVLDLREKGLDQQAAQTQAKLDMTERLAELRNATTQRGQDMISKDKEAAIAAANQRAKDGREFKIDSARGKAADALDGTLEDMDGLTSDIDKLIKHPGLDSATGVINSKLPTVKQDTADFEAALDSLKSRKAFALLARMRQLSPTGATGMRTTNMDLKMLTEGVSSLSLKQGPEALRNSLISLKDYLNLSKAHLVKGYEDQYGAAAPKGTGGGGVPVAKPQDGSSGGGKTVPVPKAYINEPDGNYFDNADGRWVKKGDQMQLVQPKTGG